MAVMTWQLSDIRTEARRLLQERTAARFQDADLTRWANEAQNFIATTTRCLRSTGTTTSVADQDNYSLPTSAVGAWGVTRVSYDSTTIQEVPYEERERWLPNGQRVAVSGTPTMWSPYGQEVILTPPPDTSAKTIKFWFAYVPDAMVNDSDAMALPDAYGPALPLYCLWKGFFLKGRYGEAFQSWQLFIQYLKIVTGVPLRDLDMSALASTG